MLAQSEADRRALAARIETLDEALSRLFSEHKALLDKFEALDRALASLFERWPTRLLLQFSRLPDVEMLKKRQDSRMR
jgi:hypothetical protein